MLHNFVTIQLIFKIPILSFSREAAHQRPTIYCKVQIWQISDLATQVSYCVCIANAIFSILAYCYLIFCSQNDLAYFCLQACCQSGNSPKMDPDTLYKKVGRRLAQLPHDKEVLVSSAAKA